MKRKFNAFFTIGCALLIVISGNSFAFAADNIQLTNDDMLLVNYGYPEESIDALSLEQRKELVKALNDNPDNVKIETSVLELDNLAEIESFMGTSDDVLVEMGADLSAIISNRYELNEISKQTDVEIAAERDISLTEAKYLKKSIEKGRSEDNSYDCKDKDNAITASGSISSSKLTYTQLYSNKSTSTAPSYNVTLTYNWISPYTLTIFTDEIVTAWGGNLNSSNISAKASYYYDRGTKWDTYFKQNAMTINETVNKGIEFKFPQSIAGLSTQVRTKTGSATFNIYQTKMQGYDTKILSQYCHRVLSVGSASIGISASGPSVGISVGGAWDTSPQRSTTIRY
ncbi:MAG: hypothetical protein K2G73_08820 [Eubacterium sp.]|nr:hypothetical protein [Eubacterium sp.]